MISLVHWCPFPRHGEKRTRGRQGTAGGSENGGLSELKTERVDVMFDI